MRGRAFVGFFVFALVVRITAIFATGAARIEFGDARDYIGHARVLCESGSYPDRGNLPFFRAPGLPLFIAATTACDTSRVVAVKIALACVDSLTVLLVMRIALALFASRTSAILAGVLASIAPLFVLAVTDVRTEPLFMFFMTLTLDRILSLRTSPSVDSAIACGLAIGAAAMTRPAALVVVPLLIVGATLLTTTARFRSAALIALAASMLLAPWTIRNFLRFGSIILVNNAGGYNAWRGSHPDLAALATISNRHAYRAAALRFETEVSLPTAAAVEGQGSTEAERAAMWKRLTRENLDRDRSAAARFALERAWWFWRPWLNPQEHGMKRAAIIGVMNAVLFSSALAGFLLIDDRRVKFALVVYLLVVWISHIPFQTVMRFRIPFTDPLFVALGAGAIAHLMRRRFTRADEGHARISAQGREHSGRELRHH